MLCAIPLAATNPRDALVKAGGTLKAGVTMPLLESRSSVLDLVWPMPIGLLVMGTAVSVFVGLCFMLR